MVLDSSVMRSRRRLPENQLRYTVGPIISRAEKELSANNQPLGNSVNIGTYETSYKKGTNTSQSLSTMIRIRWSWLPKDMESQY